MSMLPVPNTRIDNDNKWMSWFRDIYKNLQERFRFIGNQSQNSWLIPGDTPNLFLYGNTTVSPNKGLRIHYNEASNVATIDCNYPITFRKPDGTPILTVDVNNFWITFPIRTSDPGAAAPTGAIWYNSAVNKFQGRGAGVTVDFH